MICVSVVSHGQVEIAAAFLRTLAKHLPAPVSQVVYTRNIVEPDLPALDLGHIKLLVLTNQKPKGFGANHNAAFALCDQPFFCVVNPDILLTSDPFSALLDEFRDQTLGLVAPLVTTPSGQTENTARKLYTPAELVMQKLRPANHAASADWLAGMFMFFRSSAFRAVAGFDPGYHLYIEDVDICTRLRIARWRLRQSADAIVVHNAQKRSHRSAVYMRWHLAGMLRYWRSRTFWEYRDLLGHERRSQTTM